MPGGPGVRVADKQPVLIEGAFVNDQTPAIARAESGGLGLNDSIYNRLLKERIIWLGSEVRDENANAICAQMMLLAAEDPDKDIFLYINSPGGSITAGMAIYDTMQYIQPDVATVAMGMAASMGQFLLSSGAKGKRYATPHTRVLMHQPLGGLGGTASEIKIQADLILSMKREMAELTAEQTGKSVEQIIADGDRDHWYTAPEALEYGFIDRIVTGAHDVTGGGGTAE
jgi:ATP-dependent Clp protease protease subunit